MTTEQIKQKIRARQELKFSRAKANNQLRDEGKLAPPAPTVEGVIPGFNGLLPVEKLQESLKVIVPEWQPGSGWIPGDSESVTVNLKDLSGGVRYSGVTPFTLPLTPPTVTVEIPDDRIPAQGTFTVDYQVTAWNGNPGEVSETFQIIIDRQPPYYNPGHPATPAAITHPVDVVTDKYLTDNADEVVCELPDYPADRAPGDQVSVYLGLEIPDSINVTPVVGPIDVPADLKIHISGDEFRARPDGKHYVLYWLNDKAGNFSDISEPDSLELQLGPMPSGLLPPQVPLGPLITRADALEPVMVEIPAFTGADRVTIKALWGATPLPVLQPGLNPSFPLRIGVPWSALTAEYDATGLPVQNLTVRYQAWRGSLAFPEAGPLTTDVQVDLSVVGPPNPDPDPVNPNLPEVHLTSYSGETDKLTSADKGQPAKVSTELHEFPLKDEVIELWWRDKVVDTFTVDTEVEGDPIDFDITWDQIVEGKNDRALPMTYTIVAKDGNNPQRSPTTPVDVNVVTVDLAEPVFPTIDSSVNLINCSSLDCGTLALPVRIPGNSTHLKDGDIIRLDTQGFTNTNDPVPGTEFSLPYTLQPGEAALGVTLRVQPYDKHLLPIVSGRILARYSVEVDGNVVNSRVANARIALDSAGGTTCPIIPCA